MANVQGTNTKGKGAEGTALSYPRAMFIGGPAPTTVEECKARSRKILVGLGHSEPPEDVVEEWCREFFGKRYELLKLGVPFDLALPEPKDEQLKRERDYDRSTYRPLLSKVRATLNRLGRQLGQLRDAHEKHPAEERWKDREKSSDMYAVALGRPPSPPQASWDAKKIRLVQWLATFLERELDVIAYIHRAPKDIAKQVDRAAIEDVLVLAGLGPSAIAKVTKYLGKEAPAQADSDIAERVRKRLKRKRTTGQDHRT